MLAHQVNLGRPGDLAIGLSPIDRGMGYTFQRPGIMRIPMRPFGQGSLWNIWPYQKLEIRDGEGLSGDPWTHRHHKRGHY
jgi:hypothetical protein